MSEQPLFTKHLQMNVNGGKIFYRTVYNIHADGKPFGVTQHTGRETDKKVTTHYSRFVCGDKVFDMMDRKGGKLSDWLLARYEESKKSTGNVSS